MKSDLKLLFHYLRRYWFSYLLGIVSLVTVDFVNTLIPRITGNVTDGLTNGMLDAQGVFGLAMRILLYGALIMLGRFGWRYFLFGSSRSIEREIRDDLFTHIETLSPAWYHQHKTGDIMAHFTNDLLSVRKLLGMTVISTVDATLMLVLVLRGMIVYVSPKLTLIAIIPLILIIFGDLLFGRIMHRRFLARQEAFSELTDSVQ
jgi:ATP-binding cassette subfamily B protein